MPAREVVGDEVEDQADAASMGLADERLGVVVRAQPGIDRVVIDDIVAVKIPLATGAFEKRRQPDARDAEVFERIEALDNPLEIADTVLIGIAKGGDPKMIDDGVFIPIMTWRFKAQLALAAESAAGRQKAWEHQALTGALVRPRAIIQPGMKRKAAHRRLQSMIVIPN